ncbi:MAG: N-acetyltransferase [Candidatus Zixiibacteriota bacterium]|nr:MAG: N-acetyltransferase [candidate division Zixibacteria bacterium]
MNYRLEPLMEEDRTAVIDIFNHFVENSFASYREIPVAYDMFDRFLAMIGEYPAATVKTDSGQTVGFGFIHRYHVAETMRRTAEISYFILPEHTGRGIGTRMLYYLVDEAREHGISNILASISSLNDQSLQFHRRHGFIQCGRFEMIGEKHGYMFDMVWMQKQL